jgi:hypothetical protein
MDSSRHSRLDIAQLLSNPWFLLSVVFFIVHYFLQKAGVALPLIDDYLDDLLCMPVILSIALAGMRLFFKYYALSTFQIIFAVIYCAIVFELLLPMHSSKYTADVADLILYGVGAVFFAKVMNPKAIKLRKPAGWQASH